MPTQSFAAGHHSMQDGLISRETVLPQFLHAVSGSSVHISLTVSHQKHRTSSGYGVLISRLPGQLSLNMILFYQTGGIVYMSYIIIKM